MSAPIVDAPETDVAKIANYAKNANNNERDYLMEAPRSTDAMYYGPIGDLAYAASEGTEVNPVAAAAACISWLSARMGRDVFLRVGNTKHHISLYTLHSGRSSVARKGDSVGLLKRVASTINKHEHGERLTGNEHNGGLSSREGLAFLIHDGYMEGKNEVPAIEDKRLWIMESEFANVLAQAKRDGNTLSTVLRDSWDGVSIKPATKSNRLWASDPHIAIHGCITPSELHAKMSTGEMSNGFANRFLIVHAERTQLVPFPNAATRNTVESLAARFSDVIAFALGDYPAVKDTREITLTLEARSAFERHYYYFCECDPAGELITGLLQRRAPMLLRLAALFALTDKSLIVDVAHITAARAWMDYYTQSVRFIFGPLVNAEREARCNEDAVKLIQYLRNAGDWRTRSQLTKECFGGHISAADLNAALESIQREHPLERKEENSGTAKIRTLYRLEESSHNSRFSQGYVKGDV